MTTPIRRNQSKCQTGEMFIVLSGMYLTFNQGEAEVNSLDVSPEDQPFSHIPGDWLC